jgi:hypothetical protein
MGFRQNNEMKRKWNVFYEANKELIENTGLPGPTVETWDSFAQLLMHGYYALFRFDLRELEPEKFELFKVLLDRYFGAGFPDPGMHPVYAGGEEAFLRLAKKYPNQFLAYDVERANEQDEENGR